MSDPDFAAAGTALGTHVSSGTEWISTYGVPAAISALGIGLVVALLTRYGKKVRGWLS
jgi:hypothetical protein